MNLCRPLAVFTLLALLAVPAGAQYAAPVAAPSGFTDEQALFLAGIPVAENSALAPLARTGPWQQHAGEVSAQWRRMDSGRLAQVRTWALGEIHTRIQRPETLLYLFGGPDLLWVSTIFPGATNYVLAGLEPAGQMPPLADMPPPILDQSLGNLRFALRSILDKGFFETKEMREDFKLAGVYGVAPVLMFFLARTGQEVMDGQLIALDSAGNPVAVRDPAQATGVRILFRARGTSPLQTVYYFRTDLSDAGLRKDRRFLDFCARFGPAGSYLKAASYLMHSPGFSMSRDFLLTQSRFVLQDDSGIPFTAFDRTGWDIHLFGGYRPMPAFEKYFQPDLAAAMRAALARPLPFGTGYRQDDADSNQMFFLKR